MAIRGPSIHLDKITGEVPVSLKDVVSDTDAMALLKKDKLRLNLGCDRQEIAGFVGVDFNPDVDPDILADVEDLNMIEDNSVDEIYASQVLEHLPYGTKALEEWLRVLKPGGMLTVVVPDLYGVYRLSKHHATWGPYNLPVTELYVNACVFGAHYLKDTLPEMKALYGGPGHIHKQIFIEDMLYKRVVAAGYVNVQESPNTFLGPLGVGDTCVIGYKAKEGE